MDIMAEDDNIIDRIDLHMKSEHLHTFISSILDDRERQIIVLRYGLSGATPLTQREVAKKLGISRSYVSRRPYCKQRLKNSVPAPQVCEKHIL